MDNVDPAKRSEIMSKIRGKDTLPERIMWELLRELEEPPERWACMPGKPDFVFDRAGVVVFVDGCFFHRCPDHSSVPKTNRSFWMDKFDSNVRRDKKVSQFLRENGWVVMRFWECQVKKDPDEILYCVETQIRERTDELRDVRKDGV